jgi:hypothetical protein
VTSYVVDLCYCRFLWFVGKPCVQLQIKPKNLSEMQDSFTFMSPSRRGLLWAQERQVIGRKCLEVCWVQWWSPLSKRFCVQCEPISCSLR